jgi:hypothetical protein
MPTATAIPLAPTVTAPVHVCSGTWAVHLAVTTDTTLVAPEGPASTILEGEGDSAVVRVDGTRLSLSGFTLRGGRGEACDAGTCGGAVYAQDANLERTDCVVTANQATEGGGLWYAGSGTLSVLNSVISTNAAETGGGLYIEGAGATVSLDGTTVSDNTASIGGGLTLFVTADGTTLSGEGGEVSRNQALRGGGAALHGSDPDVATGEHSFTLSGLSFRENGVMEYASVGGGAYTRYGWPTFSGVEFSANTAEFGGGLAANVSGVVVLRDVLIRENAQYDWGVADWTGTFGGGLYLVASRSGVTVDGSGSTTISGNTAHWGGGVAVDPGYDADGVMLDRPILTVRGVTSSDNQAGYEGAGLSVGWYGEVALTLEDVSLDSNQADGDSGGGIVYDGSTLTTNRCEIVSNTAPYAAGVRITTPASGAFTAATISGNSDDDVFTDVGAYAGTELGPDFDCTGSGGCAAR